MGIAGGSGSGKTYLAKELVTSLGAASACLLSMDQYFLTEVDEPDEARSVNFDHPSRLDFRRMIQDVRLLREGRGINAPSYDFTNMKQTPGSVPVESRPVVVIEGLFVLAEPMVSLCDMTCFLDVAPDERLLGRIMRDLNERGASIEDVIDRYQRYVRPSYQIFVAPTMQNADIVVDFTFRRALFSQLLSGLLKTYLADDMDIDTLVGLIRNESYQLSSHPEDGYMSLTTDIFKLAQAYPENSKAREWERTLSSPAVTSFGRSPRRD